MELNETQLLATTDPIKWTNAFIEHIDPEVSGIEYMLEENSYDMSKHYDPNKTHYDTNSTVFNGTTLINMSYYDEGGYEGGGDYVSRVYAICLIDDSGKAKPVAFIKHNGSYSSYEGTEWDEEVSIVHPKQVMVTQWV